jgi:hypothetical protein
VFLVEDTNQASLISGNVSWSCSIPFYLSQSTKMLKFIAGLSVHRFAPAPIRIMSVEDVRLVIADARAEGEANSVDLGC